MNTGASAIEPAEECDAVRTLRRLIAEKSADIARAWAALDSLQREHGAAVAPSGPTRAEATLTQGAQVWVTVHQDGGRVLQVAGHVVQLGDRPGGTGELAVDLFATAVVVPPEGKRL